MNIRARFLATAGLIGVGASLLFSAGSVFAGGGGHADLGVTSLQYIVKEGPAPSTCNGDICSSTGVGPMYPIVQFRLHNFGDATTYPDKYFRADVFVDGYDVGCAVFNSLVNPGATHVYHMDLAKMIKPGHRTLEVQIYKGYAPDDCEQYADGNLLFNEPVDGNQANDSMTVNLNVGAPL